MQAIVICSVGNKGLYILLESIRQYAPELPVYVSGRGLEMYDQVKMRIPNAVWTENISKNFGDAYNNAITHAFWHGNFDSVIIANDDVVLTPDSVALLKEDAELLDSRGFDWGFLGARSDYVLQDQNIRFKVDNDYVDGVKYGSERSIKLTTVIAPIFAAVKREVWDKVKFPSINWYSDNIICADMQKLGYKHFVSRAYVHHAGSQTIGTDFQKCHEEPKAWIKEHRPDMYEVIYA